jgi:hypothetical protein
VLAIGGSVVALGGVGVAFAANPHPASTQQPDARLTALQQREATLAQQAKVVNQEHDALWSEYRTALAERNAEIDDVNAWNAEVRAKAATAAQAAQDAQAAAAASSSSSSGASPSAGYVYTPPVARSGAS